MRRPAAFSGLIVLALIALLGGCARDPVSPADPRDVIELRWVKAFPRESRSDVDTGLLWGLSLLGAQLPADARVLEWDGDRITLDVGRAQVVDGTLPAWRKLIAAVKASGEYRVHGALDAGRWMALTLGSPNHYYALTGANPDYQAARARHRFDPKSAAIVRSGVAHGSRSIDVAFADDARQIAFVAYEGDGSLADGSFVARELELVDTMPNGQLRFALYDLEGRLKHGATARLTRAGKPAKCMWCHESGLMVSLIDYPPVRGFHDRRAFDTMIERRRALLADYRAGVDTQIRYRNRQDHTYAELLYLSFEEPSSARLAREWGVSEQRAAGLLRGLPTHAHAEFAFLGDALYRREDVERLAPYEVIAAPESIREASAHEPDLVHPERAGPKVAGGPQ